MAARCECVRLVKSVHSYGGSFGRVFNFLRPCLVGGVCLCVCNRVPALRRTVMTAQSSERKGLLHGYTHGCGALQCFGGGLEGRQGGDTGEREKLMADSICMLSTRGRIGVGNSFVVAQEETFDTSKTDTHTFS